MNPRTVDRIGWIASVFAVVMFASYIDQIRLNLQGYKSSLLLPIATCLNCSAWVTYAYFKEKTDWPILFCNGFGVLVSVITAITVLFP